MPFSDSRLDDSRLRPTPTASLRGGGGTQRAVRVRSADRGVPADQPSRFFLNATNFGAGSAAAHTSAAKARS